MSAHWDPADHYGLTEAEVDLLRRRNWAPMGPPDGDDVGKSDEDLLGLADELLQESAGGAALIGAREVIHALAERVKGLRRELHEVARERIRDYNSLRDQHVVDWKELRKLGRR